MREADWLKCTSARWLVWKPPAKRFRPATERKLRLFAVAGLRTIWDRLIDDRSRAAVDALERYLEGAEDDPRMMEYARAASQAHDEIRHWSRWHHLPTPSVERQTYMELIEASEAVTTAMHGLPGSPTSSKLLSVAMTDAVDTVCRAKTRHLMAESSPEYEIEQATYADMLRDILGNPYRKPHDRPIAIEPAWATSDVVSLAGSMYDRKSFDEMPYLGDALEEAGCDRDDILAHCRGPNGHVRGCWVVDAVLGKF